MEEFIYNMYALKLCIKMSKLRHKTAESAIISALHIWKTEISKYLSCQRIQFGHSAFFQLHLSSCYFKLLISQSKFSVPRKFTLKLSQKIILKYQGPVVQSIASLTSSLRGQLVKCFTTL